MRQNQFLSFVLNTYHIFVDGSAGISVIFIIQKVRTNAKLK